MSDHRFKRVDFENPSVLFVLEDKPKGLIGGPLLYNSYFKTFGLKGNGTFFVRERIQKSHGMPAAEIRSLFAKVGLSETECRESKSEYIGRFKPASANI